MRSELDKKDIITSSQCRDYFKDCGFTYKDINEGDIQVLYMFLVKEFKKATKERITSVGTMHMSKKVDVRMNRSRYLMSAYLYLNSHYFTRREAISFHPNGFIGFCGWADDLNLQPHCRAFMKWVDWLKEE